MNHVLSVNLGSSVRDKSVEIEMLGERFSLERRGTGGDLRQFAHKLQENDGYVVCDRSLRLLITTTPAIRELSQAASGSS